FIIAGLVPFRRSHVLGAFPVAVDTVLALEPTCVRASGRERARRIQQACRSRNLNGNGMLARVRSNLALGDLWRAAATETADPISALESAFSTRFSFPHALLFPYGRS